MTRAFTERAHHRRGARRPRSCCASRAARSATARPSRRSTTSRRAARSSSRRRGGSCSPASRIKISGVTPAPVHAAPALGEHRRPRRLARAPDAAGAADRRRPRSPLDGVRVLDLTAWWAGPAAGHLLALLGADVIKVESVPRPDLMRYSSVRPPTTEQWWEWSPMFHGANNTKRGITLDLTDRDGTPVLRLVAEVRRRDRELQRRASWRTSGSTSTRSTAANPRIVMVRMPAYGLDGPWRDRTGFAQTMESITGMAWVTGWADGPPVLPRGPCDPLASAHAVFATILALARARPHRRGAPRRGRP